MRRAFLVLLLVILPFQYSWAAVTSYCQHESGAAAKHLGHHEHQHRQASPDPSADSKIKQNPASDTDCAICKLNAAPSIVSSGALTPIPLEDPPVFSYRHIDLSHIPTGLERPDWCLAV